MGPFVGSDDHVVRVVNRNGNACRQARVHWLLASLVNDSIGIDQSDPRRLILMITTQTAHRFPRLSPPIRAVMGTELQTSVMWLRSADKKTLLEGGTIYTARAVRQ